MSETVKDRVSDKVGESGFDLEAFMPFKLAVLSETVSKLIACDYADRFDITIPEWRVMALVSQYRQVRASMVVDKTPMDKVAVSRAVASLVRKGLIEKRTVPSDRRSALLHLSEKGREIAREIQMVALAHDERVLSVLTGEERQQMAVLLDKLIVRAKQLSPK